MVLIFRKERSFLQACFTKLPSSVREIKDATKYFHQREIDSKLCLSINNIHTFWVQLSNSL